MELDRRVCDRARLSRDARFDGRFFIGVITTGIYCRPICPARAPKDENVRYFPSAAAAEAAGFRPCLRCRPEASPGTPAWLGTSSIVSRGLRLISEGALDGEGVDRLADRLGVTARHLRRLFLQHLGATPTAVALTRRVHFAKKLLDETTLPFRQVAFASGFGSIRRFNGEMRRTYRRTPTELRRLARRKVAAVLDPDSYRFQLDYRPPYDWDSVLHFLAARAVPGVESVADSHYLRTVSLDGKGGTIDVSPCASRHALRLEVRFPDPRALLSIVERVRRIFDLGADPQVIGDHLSADPLLRARWARHRGMRVPGTWDGFELAVAAVLPRELAGRIAAELGTPVAFSSNGSLERLFPTPGALANARIERLGVSDETARTVRSLSRLASAGTFSVGARSVRSAFGRLELDPETLEYIAMRALGEPDAFPHGHLSTRGLERRSERWRPWRAYAAMLLWRDETEHRSRRVRDADLAKNANHHAHARALARGAVRGAGENGESRRNPLL